MITNKVHWLELSRHKKLRQKSWKFSVKLDWGFKQVRIQTEYNSTNHTVRTSRQNK